MYISYYLKLANHTKAEACPDDDRSSRLLKMGNPLCSVHGIAAAVKNRDDGLPPRDGSLQEPGPAEHVQGVV